MFTIENKVEISEITNLEEVKKEITKKLEYFINLPNPNSLDCKPLVYHVDVAAMYPNIILTNRLQPVSIVNDRMFN